jgi:tryptophan synthase alpha chain
MNRIDKLFHLKSKNILSVYFTAGYPKLEDTVPIILALQKSGVDLIEIGFPFSDPLADGPVIQRSSEIAIQNGMNLKQLFGQLERIREKVDIPLLLMGYLNPVLQFGITNFCENAKSIGIDGVILPDLPIEMYLKDYKHIFEKNSLHFIPLIPPQTSDSRIKMIDASVSGFLYLVSSASTTGNKTVQGDILSGFVSRIDKLGLKNPRLIGFGIKSRYGFENVCKYASGGIIGTAFINALNVPGETGQKVYDFISSLTGDKNH